jgi:predicted O-methyltransferase YrrM
MSKTGKALKAMGMILRNPALLNRVLSEPEHWQRYVTGRYGMGKGFPQLSLDQLSKGSVFAIDPLTFLDGGSLPTDIALLRSLACWFSGCTYFEIGTWRGESIANIAAVAGECYTLNLSDQEMTARGIAEDYIKGHRFFSADKPNVTHLYGDSRQFDFQGLNRKFDLVFIDGDHHHDFVRHDTEQVVRHLVHEKSLIVWHDYAYHPEALRYEVMAAILDGLPPQMHARLYHVAQTKCAVYIGEAWDRHFITGTFTSPVQPDHYFSMEMRLIRTSDNQSAQDHDAR